VKLLIIGGSGQLSGRLAQLAVKDGHEVYALTRGIRPLPKGVHPLKADRENPAAVSAALTGHAFDAVLDCVCMNAQHARIDLDVIAKHSRRFVVVSTDSVYQTLKRGEKQTEEGCYLADGSYGAKKREMEEVFLASGAHFTLLRPGHIFGPGFLPGCFPEHSRQKDLLSRIRAGEALRLVGGGRWMIHPVFVDDLARAMLDVIGNPLTFGRVFLIGGPDAVTNRRYFEMLGEILGKQVHIVSVPDAGYLQAHPEYSGHICDRFFDLTALEKAHVPLPQTTLWEGLGLQVQWLLEQEESK